MDFYIFPILFPGLFLDILLTISFLYFFNKKIFPPQKRKVLAAFAPASLYLTIAFIWIIIYAWDPRFQGQGILGLFLIMTLGVIFTLVRLLLGLVLFIALRRSN